MASASIIILPSTKIMKGCKWWNCRRQAPMYLHLFSRSAVCRLFSGIFCMYDTEYLLTTRIYIIKCVPLYQRSLMRRFAFFSVFPAAVGGLLGRVGLSSGGLPLCTARPECMRGSSRTCVGVRSFLGSSDTLSCSSLCLYFNRMPFFKVYAMRYG